jgi:hypothetical protein
MKTLVVLCIMSVFCCIATQTVEAVPEPTISVVNIIPTATNVEASLDVTYTRNLAVLIQTQNPNNGDFTVSYVRWMILSPPPAEAGGAVPTTINVSIPVVLLDPRIEYKFTFYAGPDVDGNGASSSWITTARTVKGYKPSLTSAFGLEFSASSLKVSATTDTKAITTLTASWQMGNSETGEVQKEGENPSVDLLYTTIRGASGNIGGAGTTTKTAKGASGSQASAGAIGAIPIINIKLEDPQTHQVQLANVQITIDASDATTKEAKQNSQSDSSNTKKANFTWGTFSQTVLGAILKYFAR